MPSSEKYRPKPNGIHILNPVQKPFFRQKNGIFRLYLSKIILQLANSSKSIWYRIIFLFPLFQNEEGKSKKKSEWMDAQFDVKGFLQQHFFYMIDYKVWFH